MPSAIILVAVSTAEPLVLVWAETRRHGARTAITAAQIAAIAKPTTRLDRIVVPIYTFSLQGPRAPHALIVVDRGNARVTAKIKINLSY